MSASPKAGNQSVEPAAQGASVPPGRHGRLKNMALFFAAPFITLSYAVMLPMAGIRWLKQMREDAARDQRA